MSKIHEILSKMNDEDFGKIKELMTKNDNEGVKNFLDKYQDYTKIEEHQYTPLEGTDGFYIAKIRRN